MAWRGVLKIWALSDVVVVRCHGRGYKRTWTKDNGIAVTKCKGVGWATVTGSKFMVYFKARLGQAKFPGWLSGHDSHLGPLVRRTRDARRPRRRGSRREAL